MKLRTNLLLSILITLFLISCSGKNELRRQLSKIADELNESAPAQLDENTVFLGAEVDPDGVFRYLYQIVNTDTPDKLMDEMESQTRTNIKEAFQINPELKIFTENNVSIEYDYRDESGNIIRVIKITPDDYK